jgi:hypothetical protein
MITNTKETMNKRKLEGAVDVELLSQSCIVCIGTGGASRLVEDLIRSGVGKLKLVDFDQVDSTNVTTQGFNTDEIGRLKVDCIKQRIGMFAPDVEVEAIPKDFFEITGSDLDDLISEASLILFMTDNFHVQALGNKIALSYAKPAVFAMMYYKGRASEIMFMIPGVTPGCYRCAVRSRYKAYLNDGYKNDVTSTGSTIFHTNYLNSVIGLTALAVLHKATKVETDLSSWFEDPSRNFIQIRNHPNYSNEPGNRFREVLGETAYTYNFDSVWGEVSPRDGTDGEPTCPDCGGTGNLLDATNKITI